MACITCCLPTEQCAQQTPDERMVICPRCFRCQLCTQKLIQKQKYPDDCPKCTQRCRSCEKALPKFLWPLVEIIDHHCVSCYYRCHGCRRRTHPSETILFKKKRWCPKCQLQKQPARKTIRYLAITQSEERGLRFLKWKVDEKLQRCTDCQESYWGPEKRTSRCDRCYRKQLREKKKVKLQMARSSG